MRISTILFCLFFSKILFSQELTEHDLSPYNDELNFKVINENDLIEKMDSLEALIIVFNNPLFENARRSIINNPHLKEIKLFASNQELLEFISESTLPKLTHLFFERYSNVSLELPSFPNIEHLTIQSSELVSLNMVNGNFNNLDILDINAPKLMNWNTAEFFPTLGLVNLDAPLLEYFPIENSPNLAQFMYYCSFKEIPRNLCNYDDLKFISFNNYSPVLFDKCLEEKIKSGYVANLTIYDKIDGKVLTEILSNNE